MCIRDSTSADSVKTSSTVAPETAITSALETCAFESLSVTVNVYSDGSTAASPTLNSNNEINVPSLSAVKFFAVVVATSVVVFVVTSIVDSYVAVSSGVIVNSSAISRPLPRVYLSLSKTKCSSV